MNVSWKAVIAVALAATALTPAAARAGTYDVWSCRGSDGAALAASAWTPTGKAADACAAGASFAVTPDGSLQLTAPPQTLISSYELWRSADDGPVADDVQIVEKAGAASYTTMSGTVGDAKHPLAAANHFAGKHHSIDAVTLAVSCDDGCTDGTRLDLYSSHVTLLDDAGPTVSAQAAGDDAVIVNAGDLGGGVASMTMSVDGGDPQTYTDCSPPYTSLVPCPGQTAHGFAVDAADGDHAVGGTVVDAAGNHTAWGPMTVSIHHDVVVAPAPSPSATPGPDVLPTVAGQVVKLSRATIVHAAGSATRLTGKLTTTGGAPVPGATLSVSSFDLASDAAEPRALPPVRTDAAGGFTIDVKRDGAQRVTVTPPAGASATATVRTNLSVVVKASKGRLVKGRLLTLQGSLRGAGASAKGTLVTIESIVNGKWAPVGSARAKAGGAYSWRYRFVHLQQDTIFRFRAVVERGPGWPWASEHSSPLRVRVDVP
jgi:hypothetical protein